MTIDDIKLALRGKENMPLIYVSGYEDKDGNIYRGLAQHYGEVE